MGASIADVAARASVSIATVSRALRGLPNVAPSTRLTVLAAVEELGYVADPNASRLAAGRARAVGLVVPTMSAWFFAQVVAGAEGLLAPKGYDSLLYGLDGAANRTRFFIELPFRKRVDALIVVQVALSDTELDLLAEQPAPVVLIGTDSERFPSVGIDNAKAARTATRHLLGLGHTDVGLISGPAHGPLAIRVPEERRSGYRQALQERQLEGRPDLDVEADVSMEGGAWAVWEMLRAEPAPTAVLAQSDEMAFGALHALSGSRLRVPQDLSVIGFDDRPDIAGFVGLTTVHQPVAGLGEAAAALALQVLEGVQEGSSPRLWLETSLVVRESTGPVRRSQEASTSAFA